MRYKILDSTGDVINTILADAQFMQNNYPDGNYREVPDAPEPVAKPTLTQLEFFNRFTQPELVGIYTAAKSSVPLEIMLDQFKMATYIDTADPQTVGGINALEAAGLIAAGRAAQILA